jgi:hypothetical protein
MRDKGLDHQHVSNMLDRVQKTAQYEYICQLEEQRRELAALTQSCLKKGFRLGDVQAMYIHHIISTCKYLTDDPDTIRTTKQTKTDKMPPEEMIARFVSLLNAIAADLALPYSAMVHPDISQKK